MGKKKSGSHGAGEGEKGDNKKARVFMLKVAMHCTCRGCIDKIRAAVKDITFLQGIESWDQSALETKGELKLVATADPEKLRQRLHKATRKNVDLIFPKDNKDAANNSNKAVTDAATAAAAQALLLNSLMQQQQQGHYGQQQNAWVANHQLLPGAGGGWNAHGGYGAAAAHSYPWAVPQQQQPDPYAAYSAGGGYPGAWGAYAYPPALQGHGGAWHGHGY